MKRFYIPTSSLNFNNILSSESISPKAFYAQRGFGYSRWVEIPENGMSNAIVLYDKPFNFTRPASDMEDHPMLIEIYTNEEFPIIKDGIYYSDHTLYLSPWLTNFIFFSEQDKLTTLSMSNGSLETKFTKNYSCKVVENYELMTLLLNDFPSIELNVEEIDRDYRINKMKGLLYGYYIGSILSESPAVTKKYNILQELQDIFSAVLSSDKLVFSQREQINNLLTELQKNVPVVSYLQSKLANPEEIEEVINQCVRLGTSFSGMINKKRIIESLQQSSIETSKDNNYALNWLDEEWVELEQQICQTRKLLSISLKEIIVINYALSELSHPLIFETKEKELVKSWINDTLLSKSYNGRINLFKKELSDIVTVKAKEIYGEQWENSEAKQMLNQMRRYIQGQESTFRWNHYLISSIAAVIAKGDDWNKLLVFMRSKEMSDYCLAFAFYGELNGFANLTRDFTDNLFELTDKQYVTDVYKELYRQVLGVSPQLSDESYAIKNSLKDRIIQAWQKIRKGLRNQDQLESDLKNALRQCEGNQDMLSFINNLFRFESWNKKGKTARLRLSKELGLNCGSNSKPQKYSKEIKQRSFYDIPDFAEQDSILDLICLKELSPEVKKRIQENWNYTADGKKYMSKEHIRYFINLCKKEGRGGTNNRKLKGIFTDELANKVEEELRRIKKKMQW